ncbi:histidine triad nucleotide-binding protein [bacterium]|nr:histidine triad nucleotide-binding protein [bacterium]
MSQDCLFCKIIANEIPSKIVYADDTVLAFEDINPQAPVHILIIPKKHIPTVSAIREDQMSIIAQLIAAANLIAKEKNLEKGFRLVMNCGEDGGQEVYHLHLHLLGGRKMAWPPG